ncbi:hypothetical protein SCHPADRAFT_727660 [Schizopora paradoxa]|uniref:BTB domain-containing protein n=1 Tax=Schizopora paradoxa TaxID=27342 RepID=A0A0H2R129_9AGAM|nr:hypothetical protein SCHPADRAFT_727660 [Schizopora paradoxa]
MPFFIRVEGMPARHETPPPQVPVPHESLWFPAGDVILATEWFLFKVHKDILSTQSSVFKDMFDFPAVNDVEMRENRAERSVDVYEGLPMVTMVGDKGKDVVRLLRTVYERQYYRRDDRRTPLETIIALLRLSTKYDFKHIQADVIMQISKEYPLNIDAYEKLDKWDAPTFGQRREYCHFDLLKHAYELKVDGLLPILYYACATFNSTRIFIYTYDGRLDPDCLGILIRGKSNLDFAVTDYLGKLPDLVHDVASECTANLNCRNKARVTDMGGLVAGNAASKLRIFHGDYVVHFHVKNTCLACDKKIKEVLDKQRLEIWEKVPSYFSFKDWDQARERLAEFESSVAADEVEQVRSISLLGLERL